MGAVDVGSVRPRLPRNSLSRFHIGQLVPLELSPPQSRRPPRGIPGGDPQGRNVTVVDLVQSGVAFPLFGLDLGDVLGQTVTLLLDDLAKAGVTTSFGIGAGAPGGPLLVPCGVPTPRARRVEMGISMTPKRRMDWSTTAPSS